MGIIIKQSIKSAVYSYIGAAIGFVNFGLLMPKLLTTEEIGLTQYIFSIVLILSQFTGLGFSNITNRLFPYFRNSNKNHHGFFTLGLFVSSIGSLLAILFYFSLKTTFLEGEADQPMLQEYIFYILPLTIITIFLNYFDVFFRALFNATIGVFLKEVFTRVLNSITIILYFLQWIDFSTFVFLYFLSYSLPTLILGIILLFKGEFKIQRPRPFLIKRLKWLMISVGGFGLITGFSNIAILQFDKYMLNLFEDLAAVGVYSTTFYFATMILLPARSIKKIATIILSESWKNNDMDNIKTIYVKSTITQLVIGSYIFLGLWVNIDNIISVLGVDFEAGRYVIFFIGLANIIDMLAGVNHAIISTSKKYIYASVFMIIMLVLIVITNWIFIPIYGIKGAAIASFISMFITTFLRYIFVWKSFNLQPYNYKHLIILLIVAITYFGSIAIPEIANPYLDTVLKGSVITILFSVMIYFSKVSEDINDKANQLLRKFIK